MFKIISSLLRQFFFWMLIFAITRAVFLLYHINLLAVNHIPFSEAIGVFWHGLRLDIVGASYVLIFPFFLLFIQSIYSPKWLNYVNRIYTFLMLVVYSLITTAELGIYNEWKTKLTAKSLMYLDHPAEIYNSSQTATFFLLIFIFLGQIALGCFLYRKYFYRDLIWVRRSFVFSALFLILTPGFLLMGLRGGIQPIVIVQSDSYFSKHNILNLAATNSGYNIFHSIFENKKNMGKNPFAVFDEAKAKAVVKNLYAVQKDTTEFILKSKRPNIVFFLLESWTADFIESLGGLPGLTPGIAKMEKEGIMFTDFYPTGTRSEQGIASIFSGFPATPLTSVTIQPTKYGGLESFVKELENVGYSTSFYFGGELVYGNIKGYVYFNEFDRITEGYDFPSSVPRGKLGVHDADVFDRQLSEIGNDAQPFFSTVFTSSTHSPFDMHTKLEKLWDGKDQNLYLNSAIYADSCISEFFRKAKKEDWYSNTLFILTPDHSHVTYKNHNYYSPGYHHGFLLLYGDVLKDEFRGKRIETISSQVDIPKTILTQLGMEAASKFHWSKNLFNPYSKHFATISFEEGLGMIRPQGFIFYDGSKKRMMNTNIPEENQDSILLEEKSYLQVLFQEYLDL
jgi:phosphoglycerol transferase MdoB-like AlkP superfamily enzyme